ncbi:hypothetical protein [Streptomyces sp. NL15-2K]|uniref:hypothetical protein n=1 Tax=Streptomyces sp. NL15-2K TaxID=376149 RepID=UPI000F57DFF3|nr:MULTISPECIES: hypothetical protein [Actinomycetes]WKX09192.1 hypothetical protein Q4V64_17505 [Kutzneria buriramensis]GCB42768.1 hypothetical protein SNL152K_51 [Streptomyces sp. NL15-2K]
METAVTVAVIIFVIIAGVFLIHRLNAQHDERIGAFRYSDALPGIGRRARKSSRATAPKAPPADATRREYREGSR